jgi:phi13 family phage major tail protein
MDNKYGEFIGVDSLYYAEVTANSTSAYTPGTPQILAPVAEIAAAPEISNVTTYYDNAAANNYVSEGKTEVKVVVPNLDSQTLAKILGKLYDQTSGKVYDNGEANPPEIALGFRYNMGKNGYRYYWYLCGTCSGGEEAATTQKESIDVKTYELTFTAYTTAKQFTVGG